MNWKTEGLFSIINSTKRMMTWRMRARCNNNSASEVSQQSAEIKGEGRKKHLANLSNASYSQLAVHIKADFESDD